MDCFGTYFTHVQTCDSSRVQSATQWTASVTIPKDNLLRNQESRAKASKLILEVWTVLNWQLYSKNRYRKVYRLVPKAQPNSTVKYTYKYEPGNGDGRTQLQETFAKIGNGIPAQERHLRKESGQMATEIAPKLRF